MQFRYVSRKEQNLNRTGGLLDNIDLFEHVEKRIKEYYGNKKSKSKKKKSIKNKIIF